MWNIKFNHYDRWNRSRAHVYPNRKLYCPAFWPHCEILKEMLKYLAGTVAYRQYICSLAFVGAVSFLCNIILIFNFSCISLYRTVILPWRSVETQKYTATWVGENVNPWITDTTLAKSIVVMYNILKQDCHKE